MTRFIRLCRPLKPLAYMLLTLLFDGVRFLGLCLRPSPILVAEGLFLLSPQAHTLCERLLGTLRRECVDFLIPLSENHLRRLLQEWVRHYNAGRPHMSLGPGIPQPSSPLPVPLQEHRHRVPAHLQVVERPILGGLHHEYRLAERAA